MFTFRVYICVNEWGKFSQPDPTQDNLDQGADGNNEVRCPCYQQPPDSSSWSSDLVGQNHSNSFGQDSGNSHSEHHSKCGLLQDASGCVGVANEEKRAEKTAFKGDEQDVAESPVICLHDGSVLLLQKDPKNES